MKLKIKNKIKKCILYIDIFFNLILNYKNNEKKPNVISEVFCKKKKNICRKTAYDLIVNQKAFFRYYPLEETNWSEDIIS